MSKELVNGLFLLVGILFGMIIAINIQYPFEMQSLDVARTICQGQTVKRIKINVTGRIKEVQCANLTIFRLD